jgi:hypothetical protein
MSETYSLLINSNNSTNRSNLANMGTVCATSSGNTLTTTSSSTGINLPVGTRLSSLNSSYGFPSNTYITGVGSAVAGNGSYTINNSSTFTAPVVFTASTTATTMTVKSITSGKLVVGQVITTAAANAAITSATKINSFGTGSGGVGTYTISLNNNNDPTFVATITTNTTLTVSSLTVGFIGVGTNIYNFTNGLSANVIAITSGTVGGVGTYTIDTKPDSSFYGTISGTTLTVISMIGTTKINVGTTISGGGVTGTTISAILTGTGGIGTYTVAQTQTVATATVITGVYNQNQSSLTWYGTFYYGFNWDYYGG